MRSCRDVFLFGYVGLQACYRFQDLGLTVSIHDKAVKSVNRNVG